MESEGSCLFNKTIFQNKGQEDQSIHPAEIQFQKQTQVRKLSMCLPKILWKREALRTDSKIRRGVGGGKQEKKS